MRVQPLILLGHGGFGREMAAWIKVRDLPYRISGFLDDTHGGPDILGPILGHSPGVWGSALYLTCFGDGRPRQCLRKEFESRGARFATVVFPEVTSASDLSTTRNSIFLGACSISNNVAIGDDVLVQGFAIVGHDVEVGDGCSIGNHAFVGGGAKLGRCSTIHPHAVVLPNVKVGEGAVVGAGSVVIKDVEPYTTVFGAPAKMISRAQSHD
jgi:sugar O-acyltransferase (sialic acid O-acetyltransferase NeuD family)